MTAFIADYIAYVQESRLKSEILEYKDLNAFFWNTLENSHWRGKRENFVKNYEGVIHKVSSESIDDCWERHLKNYIARDNLFNYLDKIDAGWIAGNLNPDFLDELSGLEEHSAPLVFITVHNFFQTLIPLVLAQYLGPVNSFALDDAAEKDPLIRSYLTEMYKRILVSLNGGVLLKVGGAESSFSKKKSEEVLEAGGIVYAAIDIPHPTLGTNTRASVKANYFEFDVLYGIVVAGLKVGADFKFPYVYTNNDGGLCFEMHSLTGTTVDEVLSSFQKVFDGYLSKDVASWEGASLMTFKEGRFI